MESTLHRFSGPLLALILAGTATASNVAMSVVPHPVHLGEHADPSFIPLSGTAAWSNYNYGIHALIAAPRAFLSGGLRGPAGEELNMNLASLCGIEVLADDPTSVPYEPVVLKVGEGPLPVGLRHSREQVLAATLWSLIRLTAHSEDHPLVVRIDATDESLQRYAGRYLMEPDGLGLRLGRIDGSRLRRLENGVLGVAFDPIACDEGPAEIEPLGFPPRVAFVPLMLGGGATGEDHVVLVPHWTGNFGEASPLALCWAAVPRAMNAFSAKLGENANPLHDGPFQTLGSLATADHGLGFAGPSAEAVDEPTRRLFAAACFSALLTEGVAEDRPFAIRFHISGDGGELPDAPEAWRRVDRPHGGADWIREFRAVPETLAGYRVEPWFGGGWLLVAENPAE